jgi:hypothetical protein
VLIVCSKFFSLPHRTKWLTSAMWTPTLKSPPGSRSTDSASSRSRAVGGSMENTRSARRSRRPAMSAADTAHPGAGRSASTCSAARGAFLRTSSQHKWHVAKSTIANQNTFQSTVGCKTRQLYSIRAAPCRESLRTLELTRLPAAPASRTPGRPSAQQCPPPAVPWLSSSARCSRRRLARQ